MMIDPVFIIENSDLGYAGHARSSSRKDTVCRLWV
jgi:hypothetical protein